MADDDRYLTGGGEIIPEQRSASYATNTSLGPFSGGAILAGQEDAIPIVGGRFTTQLPEGLSATLSRTGQAGAPMEYARDAIRLAKQLEAGQLALEASRVGSEGLPSYGLQYSGQIGREGGAPSYYPQPKGHWYVEAGGTPSTPERHVRGGARFNFADGGHIEAALHAVRHHLAGGGFLSDLFSGPDYLSTGEVASFANMPTQDETNADFFKADRALRLAREVQANEEPALTAPRPGAVETRKLPPPPAPLAFAPEPEKNPARAAIDEATKLTGRAPQGPELSARDRDLIIRTIAAETSGKSPEESQAIAHVILNRIQSGQYGASPEAVLFAKKQFEPWSNPAGANYPMRFTPESRRYGMGQTALDAALGAEDITGGATNFWAPKAQAALGRRPPEWGRTGGMDIGETRFHKLERAEGGLVDDALHVVREHHADGEAVGLEMPAEEPRPLTIYRGNAPVADEAGGSGRETVPAFSYMPTPESVERQAARQPAYNPAERTWSDAGSTEGERLTRALGVEGELPKGETSMSAAPTGWDKYMPQRRPGTFLKRTGEAFNENADMVEEGLKAVRAGNYGAGALGMVGGALGAAISPLTGMERVLVRDPYLRMTGNLKDAQAAEMAADVALTGGLRGMVKPFAKAGNLEKLAAEPMTSAYRLPSPAATGAATAAGAMLAPEDAEAGAVDRILRGLRAYHGSPYKFDRFDLSKIGAGEGAQAFGHGLYFAEHEPTAKYYRDTLAHKGAIDLEQAAHERGLPLSIDAQREIRRQASGSMEPLAAAKWAQSANSEMRPFDREKLADLIDTYRQSRTGHMYEVNINADPDRLLNWNKQLKEQPEGVVRSLQDRGLINMDENIGPSSAGVVRPLGWTENVGGLSGEKLYRRLIENQLAGFDRKGAEALASKELASAGVPGIKYLDAGSLNATGIPTHNYVIFDDKLIDINRRYADGGEVEAQQDPMGNVTVPAAGAPSDAAPSDEPGLVDRAMQFVSQFNPVGNAEAASLPKILRKAVSPEDAMMMVHNLRGSRLADVEKLGGLPVPSTAIVKPSQGFTSFGDITMVAPKEMAQPSRANPIFGADVYSPRFPATDDAGERIFKGFTPSGTRRYAPLTLENAVKEMKGHIRGGEGFDYGAGTIRAGVAPQFKSIKEIQNARDLIKPREEMQGAFDLANEKLNALAERYYPHYNYGGDQWTHMKDFSDMLREAGMGKWGELRKTYKSSLPPELYGETANFLNYLKQLPTEYFEGKPQRAVRLNEFRGAVVPGDIAGEQADILRRMGVERLEQYDPNSPASRIEALQKFGGEQFAEGGSVVDRALMLVSKQA